jgi:acyl carrier protein
LTESEIHAALLKWVTDSFLYTRPGYQLGPEDRLLETGILDSMGVMELLAFLETTFGTVIADNDVTDENLGSLRAITTYVFNKQQTKGRPS